MITVILAVAFVGMLVFVILYLALVNFKMKQTDLNAKGSFYSAEKALDEIRAGLQEKEGDALSSSYTQVLESYASTTVQNSLELRKAKFNEVFVSTLQNSLKDTNINTYNLSLLDSFIKREKLKSGEKLVLASVSKNVGAGGTGQKQKMTGSQEKGILLEGLQVTYVDAKGRASVIETDIRMAVPDVNFTQSSSMPDLMNMTLVANEGLLVNGESTVKGSVYAGNKDTENGITIAQGGSLQLGGERVVTNGSVFADTNSKLNCPSGTALWARNVQVKSADVQLLGKTYLADDLTIDTALGNLQGTSKEGYLNGSTVTLAGEYYGYGSEDSAKKSKASVKKMYDDYKDTGLESSIIVNGKDTSLDMSGLAKLMLGGNSYIGSKKVNAIPGSDGDDVLTGESVTVKGNQLAYLVPPECLFTGEEEYSNPMTYESYIKGLERVNTEGISEYTLDHPIQKLNHMTLRSLGVTGVKKIFSQNGGTVSYYMAFPNNESASKYFQDYLGIGDRKEALDSYLGFYVNENNGIQIRTPDRFLRYITKGNVFSYEKGAGILQESQSEEGGTLSLENEQVNYQDIFYTLNKKMINNYAALKDGTESTSRDETALNRFVFENMVDLDTMKQYIKDNDSTTGLLNGNNAALDGTYRFQTAATKQMAYLVDTKNVNFSAAAGDSTASFHITKEMAEGSTPLRFVICNGPVIVEQNVNFKGVILTNSTLTLEKGANIEAYPEDAARVFQCPYDNGVDYTPDKKRPMDFFWDSTQYIINGAASGGDAGGSKDVLDLSDLVTYENWVKK